MNRRIIFLLLCIVAISIVGIATGTLRNPKKAKATFTVPNDAPRQTRQNKPDPPGTIDGAKNPELIPDRVAYMLLFRFISNHRNTEAGQQQIREYVRQIGLGKQLRSGDSDVDALIAIAESFQQQVSILDAQAKDIKDRTWPNPSPEVMTQLTLLQQQKEALADEIIASLPRRLSASGLQIVIRHINQRIKHLTKKFLGPPNLPNGPGWREHPPNHHT